MMSLRRKIFYAATALMIAVLLVLPATGWLVRLQLLLIHPNGKSGVSYLSDLQEDAGASSKVFRSVAERTPGDFGLQYAAALQAANTAEKIKQLSTLQRRFPNEPAISAGILRLMCSEIIPLRREEGDKLSPPRKDTVKPVVPRSIDSAQLERFKALAKEGEAHDSNNAFFPVMQAIGYFAAHQDAEGIAAWKRASEKTEWNDYVQQELQDKQRLLIAVNGGDEVGYMQRAMSWAAILLPHFSNIRQAARMATVMAVDAELQGNSEEGLAIRQATRRIGETLQSHGNTLIGSLVGRAVVAINISRRGGAPALEKTETGEGSSERFVQRKRDAYVSYLNRIGHPEESHAFAEAVASGERVRTISSKGLEASYSSFGDKTKRLLMCWLGDGLLIAGALFAFAFAGLFGLIFHFSPRLQEGQPLQVSARWGATVGILGMIAATATVYFSWICAAFFGMAPDALWFSFGICFVLGLVVPPFLLRLDRRQVMHGLLVLLATVAFVGELVGVAWLCCRFFGGMYTTIVSLEGMLAGEPDSPYWMKYLPMLISGATVLVPVLLLGVFALFSRMLRIPVAAGVTRGMRAMGVPLACILLFGYAICVCATIREEKAAIAEQKKITKLGEMRAFSEMTGAPMP